MHHKLIINLGLKKTANWMVGNCYLIYYWLYDKIAGTPLLVYQMGKVGSRTIVETLKANRINRAVFHVHYLTPSGLNFDQHKAESLGRAYPGKSFWTGKYLQKYLPNNHGKNLDIVVLTRDPVARNISAFFHSMDYWFPQFNNLSDQSKYSTEIFDQIKKAFLDRYHHQKALDWFREELDSVFGIDIYQTRFPENWGYHIVERIPYRVLVLKLERLNEFIHPALKEFLGIDASRLSIKTANLSRERSYFAIYKQFLDWLILPDEYLDAMYNSRYAGHFYSADELSGFRSRWLKEY